MSILAERALRGALVLCPPVVSLPPARAAESIATGDIDPLRDALAGIEGRGRHLDPAL